MRVRNGDREVYFDVTSPLTGWRDGSLVERPVILAVPREGLPHEYFRPWLDSLTDVFSLVYMDLPGSGRSSRHPGSGYPMDGFVHDIETVRDALGVARVVLLGHSFGGQVALEYALAKPDRVSGLVLCGTAASSNIRGSIEYEPDLLRMLHDLVAKLQGAQETGRAEDWSALDEHPWWSHATRTQFHGPVPELWDKVMAEITFGAEVYFMNTGSAAIATERTPPVAWDLRPRLADVRVPTLIVHGGSEAEYSVPADPHAYALHDGIAGSRLEVLPEAGTYPWVERPAEFRSLVSSFLSEYGMAGATFPPGAPLF